MFMTASINPLKYYYVIPDLNIPPVTIADRPRYHKRACCIPYLLPSAISVESENYVSTLITPCGSPRLFLLSSDYPNHLGVMKKIEITMAG